MTKPSTLLLVDWQTGLRETSYYGRRNNPLAEENAACLLSAWRERGWPVVHVRHASVTPGSPLEPHKPGFALEPFAEPRAGEAVITKSVNSAFIGTTLEERLRTAGQMDLVLTGVSSDHCVNTTARMAANLGFAVTIAHDACYAFDREGLNGERIPADTVHVVALASLDKEFAALASTGSLLAAIARDGGAR
ncbi:MAG: isochorismatase family protein [Rhizobiales bacterium]|nr:isochorismatase family protein [Hyphomicrobiales bacterium]